MKVLSAKQPFTYLLCAGIKDIENRTWPLPKKYVGERIFIQASGKPDVRLRNLSVFTKEQWKALTEEATRLIIDKPMLTSAIIGSVRFVDCVTDSKSIWAENYGNHILPVKTIYHWKAEDPVLFEKPILNVKGRLGFWDYPGEMIVCPECGKICLHSGEGMSQYVHNCEHCGFWITESDYETVK